MNFLAGVVILTLAGVLLPVIVRLLRVPGNLGAVISSAGYVLSAFLLLAPSQGSVLSHFFTTDAVARLMGFFILLASWMTMLVIYWIVERDRFAGELVASLMVSTGGALLLVSSANFVSLVISMELMTLPTYLMVLFRLTSESVEAGVKFFFQGALALATMLFGVSLIYGMTGTFEFTAIAKELFKDPLVTVGTAMILAGFGFKLTAFPFHFWGPDVYDGACPGVSALLTGISKGAGFIALMKVVFCAVAGASVNLPVLFAVLSVATMTVGNLLALAQKRVSRILAYSSVAHAGYTFIGFSALSAVPLSVTGIVYHSAAYVFMKTAVFLCFAVFLFVWGARTMEDFKGLGRREPLLSALFLLFLLSLAGVPPMAGFISKVFVFASAVKAGMTWLALVGLLNSAFSVAYYIWIAKQMYLEEPVLSEPVNTPADRRLIVLPLLVMAVALVVLGVWINPVVGASASFAEALPTPF